MQIHFWTADINAAIRTYTEVLGFTLAYAQPDGGPYDFCILKLGEQQVMFGIPPHELVALERNDQLLLEAVNQRIGKAGPLAIYIAVPDVAVHYAHAQAEGAEILEPLWQAPWNSIQYSLQDMDGHLLTFYQSSATA